MLFLSADLLAEKLAQILNVDIDKIKEDKEDIRKKLKDLSREELIEQFMRAKVCLFCLKHRMSMLTMFSGKSRLRHEQQSRLIRVRSRSSGVGC